MNKKIILLVLIIAIVGGFFALGFYRNNMFSKGILRLEILGPDTAKAGEEIEYSIKYKNNGNFVLESPKLIFDLPDSSLTEDSKTRITQNLNDIYPGDEQIVKIKARLLGKENDLKTAKAMLSYTPKNLTVPYESETSFTLKISEVPITLDFDVPSKVELGKELQLSINYFSNIDYPLENLSLKFIGSEGFELKSSDPVSLDGLEWRLETLNKAEGGRITIQGSALPNNENKLVFSAEVGMWQNGNFIVIKEIKKEVQMIQPLLFISQQVNGSASYIASPGETLHYEVFFRNIGTTPFEDLFMIAKFEGSALDSGTIQAQGGQVSGNMIVWDHRQIPQLRHLNEQEEGKIDFFVKIKDNWDPSNSDENGNIITNEINISQIVQKFSIKVNSGLALSQTVHFKNTEMQNSGPIPPKAGEATTYTVTWDIKNYFNDAKNVKVKAVLPESVSLTGKIFPENENKNFTFDSASREIVWSAGDILAGTGVRGDPYTISFQISLLPTASQKGSAAQLIGRAQISGENQFTETLITASAPAINSILPDDFVNSGGGIVQ